MESGKNLSMPAACSGSTPFRRRPLQSRNERTMGGDINGTMPQPGRGRILAQVVLPLPVPCGPNRTRRKAAAAVRADVLQQALGALRAKRAFEGADPRLRGVGGQRLVAVLAGWPEFEHGYVSKGTGCVGDVGARQGIMLKAGVARYRKAALFADTKAYCAIPARRDLPARRVKYRLASAGNPEEAEDRMRRSTTRPSRPQSCSPVSPTAHAGRHRGEDET